MSRLNAAWCVLLGLVVACGDDGPSPDAPVAIDSSVDGPRVDGAPDAPDAPEVDAMIDASPMIDAMVDASPMIDAMVDAPLMIDAMVDAPIMIDAMVDAPVMIDAPPAPITIPDGTYTWGTWQCTNGTRVTDLKAFAQSLGITDIQKTYLGSTGHIDVFRTPACDRATVFTDVSYPAAMQVRTTTANSFTCSATCTAAQCTAGSQAVLIDTYNFVLVGGNYTFNRVMDAASVTGTLQQFAGCQVGDIESGTDIRL